MQKLVLFSIGFMLLLGSCSKHSQVSCPSFKDRHQSASWSFDFPKTKKKSTKLYVRKSDPEHMTSQREQINWEMSTLSSKHSDEALYASTEPLFLQVPEINKGRSDNKTNIIANTAVDQKKQGKTNKIGIVKQALKYKALKKEELKNPAEPQPQGKSQLVALLLAILIGGLGIHRFYLGYTTIGIIQLLTAGGCGIWALIDIIRIATGDLKPKNGEYTETL